MVRESRRPSVHVVATDCAYAIHHQIVLSYFTGRVTVDSLRALHLAHMDVRSRHPAGTVTLALVASSTAIPGSDVRRFAAQIGRQASVGLLGEGIVLEGHPFWVAMARSSLRAIQLISHSMHSRSFFDDPSDGARWALSRAGRPPAEHDEVVAAIDALVRAMQPPDAKHA